MKLKSFFLTTLLLLTLFFPACADNQTLQATESTLQSLNETDLPQSENETYPETVIIRDTIDEENPLQFDFEEALNNIYIEGKKAGFPKTPADFGEDFKFGDLSRNITELTVDGYISWEGIGVSTTLKYQNNDFGITIFLNDCTTEDYNFNSEVNAFRFSLLNNNSSLYGIYKFRVGDKVTKDDIKAYFGEPTTEKKYTLYYEQEKPFQRHIAIQIGDFDGISAIEIVN